MSFMLPLRSLWFVPILFLYSAAGAQVTNKPPDRMKMLNAFNGEWKGEMITEVEKKKIKYKLSHTSEKLAGGWGVQLNEVAMIPGEGKYNAARIFSYDATNDLTLMYVVDTKGESIQYSGSWEGNKKLMLSATIRKDGKEIKKYITYNFLSPKAYSFRSITSSEGVDDEIVEMNMERQ